MELRRGRQDLKDLLLVWMPSSLPNPIFEQGNIPCPIFLPSNFIIEIFFQVGKITPSHKILLTCPIRFNQRDQCGPRS